MVTIRPKKTSAGVQTYSLPNIHGDIFATVNADGTLTGTAQTGPFGEVLAASSVNTQTPTNTLSNASFTYVGQHEKLSETALAVAPIQMGARVYIPGLGRFLSVDPELGGTDNNYAYANDPVNDFDLDGTKINFKKIATIASFASVLPGPVGMIAAGVSAAAYAAAGDKKAAAIACAGIALAAVGAGAAVVAVKAAKVATAARAGEGAYGLGKAGKLTASLAGRMYVGRGATKIQQGGRTFLQSADGLRRYGAPITKDSG